MNRLLFSSRRLLNNTVTILPSNTNAPFDSVKFNHNGSTAFILLGGAAIIVQDLDSPFNVHVGNLSTGPSTVFFQPGNVTSIGPLGEINLRSLAFSDDGRHAYIASQVGFGHQRIHEYALPEPFVFTTDAVGSINSLSTGNYDYRTLVDHGFISSMDIANNGTKLFIMGPETH